MLTLITARACITGRIPCMCASRASRSDIPKLERWTFNDEGSCSARQPIEPRGLYPIGEDYLSQVRMNPLTGAWVRR